MPLPANFVWNSGKEMLMGSLADFLMTQIPDEFFDFDNPILPTKLPGYGVTEKGLYTLAPVAFEHLIGYGQVITYSGYSGYSGISGESGYSAYSGVSGYSSYGPIFARQNQTLVEISAWDDESIHSNAMQKIRRMRDKIVYLLYNAGRTDDNGVFVIPPIKLYDYSVTPKVEKGLIVLDPSDNSINERLVIDPINQNIKVYKLLCRLFWYEYL